MQQAMLLMLILASAPVAFCAQVDPMGKVFQMLDELKAEIVAEGETEAKAYKDFFDWCDDTASEKGFEIKSATSKKADLEAVITETTSDASAAAEKIEELAATISKDGTELKEATAIREKDAAEFVANEAELVDTIDTISRAVGILEKEMAKSAAAFAQLNTKGITNMVTALKAVIGAAGFKSQQRNKLLALVQSKQQDAEDDDEDSSDAPAAAVYESKSGGIFDLLEDLKEEAEEQLSTLRKAETTAQHNYKMLKQSLDDSIAADTKASDEEKAAKAAAEEKKAGAESELELTLADLKDSTDALELAKSNCIQTAADHEASVTARTEELTVLEEAKKILKESTSGAVSQTYSMLQVAVSSQVKSRVDLARNEVLTIVKRLAHAHHSAALTQLASRIAAVTRFSARSGADPFGKVKTLITGLIKKLEDEAAAEATEKSYCDEQMSKTEAKKAEVEEDVSKLTTKIDEASAKSTQLKEEVTELQKELGELAKSQAEMDKIRSEEHAAYTQTKTELEAGLAGVRKALSVLKDYYGSASASASLLQQPAVPEHSKATGAGDSIISILEVCESDFATGLAKAETEETDAEAEYEKMTQENTMTKTLKDQDVKYKTQKFTALDKSISDLSSDLETEKKELAAVDSYYAKIKDRCIAKPESYEERAASRAAEIKGLKEALSVLETETALVQRRKRAHKGHHFLGF